MELSNKEISPIMVHTKASSLVISRGWIKNTSSSDSVFISKASFRILPGASSREESAPTNYDNKDSQERATRIYFFIVFVFELIFSVFIYFGPQVHIRLIH